MVVLQCGRPGSNELSTGVLDEGKPPVMDIEHLADGEEDPAGVGPSFHSHVEAVFRRAVDVRLQQIGEFAHVVYAHLATIFGNTIVAEDRLSGSTVIAEPAEVQRPLLWSGFEHDRAGF